MFNLSALVNASGREIPQGFTPPLRRRVTSDPILPARLPSTAFLQREAAEDYAPKALANQLTRQVSLQTPCESSPTSPNVESPGLNSASSSSSFKSWKAFMKQATKSTPSTWKEPQAFEILRAVEKKDLVFLMEVRDKSFKLLLQKTGDTTPLLHAMRIGQSHREVAIILLGAFSRWVNHLEDSDMKKPETRPLLKALRANLKLAIDYGLAKSQSDLIASFLQTLIMSEGDKWLHTQVATLCLALRAPAPDGKPVQTAETAVRRFATRELGKAELIATLEDYVANAVVDLLMMAAWQLVSSKITDQQAESIPTWYFARDDRVYKAFTERLEKYQVLQRNTIGHRLKSQLDTLCRILEGRTHTYRSKVEALKNELDEG